jgi:dienelactone hydrolase
MGILVGLACCALAPATALAIDPETEAKNYSKLEERNRYVVLTPEFQARLAQQNVDGLAEIAQIQANDPERNPSNICASRQQECAGDVRYYDWEDQGFGIVEPVLYTARDGATISGTVWATEAGPASRPGVVITPGSVQAPETLYWPLAATLAKHGYVVLVYDVQGQGRSDVLGEEPDAQEGVPSQQGQPFFDGTEDGLDFLLSTPDDPYDPRPSCGNANEGIGTDHSEKQDRRVEEGRNAAFNPLWEMVDSGRIGIAGHSLGASAVSYVGQLDPRVDALVAWDNLSAPGAGTFGDQTCPSGSSPRPESVPITKPAMGMSNDYGLTPTPQVSDPDPEGHNDGFQAYKDAGVASMQVNRRGGSHFEYSFIPGMTVHSFGQATLRGMDMAAWYTTAWLDRYVKCQGNSTCQGEADARLLTDRWRDDRREGEIDPDGDPNLYSFYLHSRYDLVTAGGTEVSCDDMRAGCPSMAPDGLAPNYTYLADTMTPDGPDAEPEPCALGQAGGDGPDTLTGTDAGDSLRGHRGRDDLSGGDGGDCLYGNRGGDRLDGGAGEDELRGGRGADTIEAADGEADAVACGRGDDLAQVDDGLDEIAASCETLAAGTP